MRYFTKTIPAGGAVLEMCPGKVLTIQSCGLAKGVFCSFDGGAESEIYGGYVGRVESGFHSVNIINRSSSPDPVLVRFAVGYIQADYIPSDNSVAPNSTVIYANGGNVGLSVIQEAKNDLGASWDQNQGKVMDIVQTYSGSPGRAYVPGTGPGPNGKNRRKSIVIQNTGLSGNGRTLGVFDSGGNLLLIVPTAGGATTPPTTLIFETDATLYLAGIGGPIGQGSLLYHEHYFTSNY